MFMLRHPSSRLLVPGSMQKHTEAVIALSTAHKPCASTQHTSNAQAHSTRTQHTSHAQAHSTVAMHKHTAHVHSTQAMHQHTAHQQCTSKKQWLQCPQHCHLCNALLRYQGKGASVCGLLQVGSSAKLHTELTIAVCCRLWQQLFYRPANGDYPNRVRIDLAKDCSQTCTQWQ